MTLQEIQTLVAAGYTKADIDLLQSLQVVQQPVAQPQVVQPQVVQQPVAQPQVVQQPVAQPQVVQPQVDFAAALAALGAAINQPAQQPQPTNVLPASLQAPQVQQTQTLAQQLPTEAQQPQIAQTPSNAGITPEEATKLFQAWSMGQATQNIELPPTAQDILEKRFSSLYGVDTSNKNNK